MSHPYLDNIQRSLINFQFIEESLRMYISYAYEVVQKQTTNFFPFKYTYKDLTNDSMGRLVEKFSKLNSNTALIAELKRLTPIRNNVAHQSLLLKDGEIDDVKLNEKLTKVVDESKTCLELTLNEWKKIETIAKKAAIPKTG